MTEGVARAMLPEVLSDCTAMLTTAVQEDGFCGGALAVPTATLWAISRVPWLTVNLASVAFAISVGLALLASPVLVGCAIRCIVALSDIGMVRKTLSISLIVAFSWAVPVLSTVALAMLWSVLGLCVMVFIGILPLILTGGVFMTVIPRMQVFCEAERAKSTQREARGEVPDDITLAEFLLALAAGVLSMCTVAPLVVMATVVKSPFTFLGVVLSCMKRVLDGMCRFVEEIHDPCWKAFAVCCFVPCFVAVFCICSVIAVLGIAFSAIAKVVGAIYWPTYVACGWLRTVSSRRQHRSIRTVCIEAAQAMYQVMWFSDIITNAATLMRPDLAEQAGREIIAISRGESTELSPEVRRLSCLPPVVIGVLRTGGGWRVELRSIARALNVPVGLLEKAWDSFFGQMVVIGRRCIRRELLTSEYIAELPPALLIGLPGVVVLETIERSPVGAEEFILADGTKIDNTNRPRARFANEAWAKFLEAKKAYEAALTRGPFERELLEAVLLAGGAPIAELPPALATAVASALGVEGQLPAHLSAVHKPIAAVVLKLAQEATYKQYFQERVCEALVEHGESGDEFEALPSVAYEGLDSEDEDLDWEPDDEGFSGP